VVQIIKTKYNDSFSFIYSAVVTLRLTGLVLRIIW